MTQQEARIPLEALELAPENPRRTLDESALGELAEAIAAQGLLQNLVAYEESGRYFVVAGGRRLRALQRLAEAGRLPANLERVPVQLVPKERGLEVALIENLQREDAPPLEEAEAFAQLLDRGLDVEEIARRVGKSAKLVRERIALARKLGDTAKQLLASGKITLGTAALLARLPEGEQAPAAGKFLLDPEGAEAYLKGLFSKTTIPKSRILFPLKDYLARGGEVLEDLFGESEPRLTDRKLVLELQEAAAKAMADRFAQQGPAELVIGHFDIARYRAAREGEVGTTYVVFDPETAAVNVHPNLVEVGQDESPAPSPPATEATDPAVKNPEGAAGARVTRVEPRAPVPTRRSSEEWAALKAGIAARYVRPASPRLAMALVVYGAVNATSIVHLSHLESRLGARFYPDSDGRDLEGVQTLNQALEELVGAQPTLNELLKLPKEALEEAFRIVVALAIHDANVVEGFDAAAALTVGNLDERFLSGLPKAVLTRALEELGAANEAKGKKSALVSAFEAYKFKPVPKSIVAFLEGEK